MSETPQDPQLLQQIVEPKQYHAPELREYGTVQDVTQTNQTVSNTQDNDVASYVTGGVP